MLLTDKPMPNNPEAERMTLGAMILDNSTIAQAVAQLKPSDYFIPTHRKIYQVIVAINQAGRKVDPMSIGNELDRIGELYACGGHAYIAALFDGVPRFSDISNYVRIVKGKAVQRYIIQTASKAMSDAFDGELEPSELLTLTRRNFETIDEPELQANWRTAESAVSDYLSDVDRRLMAGHRYDGLALGFETLDEELGGLPYGTLSLVASRPGMGKTAFLAGIAQNAPKCPDNPDLLVAFFCCEMPTSQVVQRMMGSGAEVPIRAMRNLSAFQAQSQARRIYEAARRISALPIVFDEASGLTPARFKAEVRRLQRENPKKKILALVDYLQLMEPDERKGMSAYDRATLVSTGLMRATKELGIVTVAAAQLRRPDKGKIKKPSMDELRDSGQIEQDAAVIMFPYRPAYYEQQEHHEPRTEVETDAQVIIGKGRFSGFSEVEMHFDPKTTRYIEPQRVHSYAANGELYD